ncbi:MAG: peptide chain release factor N(5)-glutamine methyltransferase [Burkholderiaceae bacterium]
MASTQTIAQALRGARERGVERLDAQLLLGRVLGRSRAWLMAHGEDPIAPGPAAEFAALALRRADGEPFAYLVGEREFHGLTLAVDPAVLVPRPDTETLVDWALELLAGPPRGPGRPAVADLGTGSGAIALALKSACPSASVWAVERSAAALDVARGNARRLALDVRFAHGDWWSALDAFADAPRFDLAASNPPYIAADDPHLAALAHEPRSALVADDGGLADIVRIAAQAPARIRDGGWLLFEHGWEQAPAVRAILARSGFAEITTRADLEGRPRCSGGRR